MDPLIKRHEKPEQFQCLLPEPPPNPPPKEGKQDQPPPLALVNGLGAFDWKQRARHRTAIERGVAMAMDRVGLTTVPDAGRAP